MNGCWILPEWGYADDDGDWAFGSATVNFVPGPNMVEVAITSSMVLDTLASGGCGFIGLTTRQPDGSDLALSFGSADSGGPYELSIWDPNMSSFTFAVGVINNLINFRIVVQVW